MQADEYASPYVERSKRRLESARNLMEKGGPHDEEFLLTLARDHTGGADSVCSHPSDAVVPSQTLYSIVVDPGAGTLRLAAGIPCQNDFRLVHTPWGDGAASDRRPGAR
jgi:hypothetical protein